MLTVGTNLLSVAFTPTDTTDYASVTGTLSLVVLPAPLTVTASNATRPYGQNNPVFTGTITGLTNGDNITATYSCNATPASPPGPYLITPILSDPNDRLGNYTVTTNNGTLTVGGVPMPGIVGISLSGTNLVFSGNNGLSGRTYYVLMSTSLALPRNQWVPVATNQLSGSGSFTLTTTNAVSPAAPQRFYMFQVQ